MTRGEKKEEKKTYLKWVGLQQRDWRVVWVIQSTCATLMRCNGVGCGCVRERGTVSYVAKKRTQVTRTSPSWDIFSHSALLVLMWQPYVHLWPSLPSAPPSLLHLAPQPGPTHKTGKCLSYFFCFVSISSTNRGSPTAASTLPSLKRTQVTPDCQLPHHRHHDPCNPLVMPSPLPPSYPLTKHVCNFFFFFFFSVSSQLGYETGAGQQQP
jgi:hypothetical protein